MSQSPATTEFQRAIVVLAFWRTMIVRDIAVFGKLDEAGYAWLIDIGSDDFPVVVAKITPTGAAYASQLYWKESRHAY